MSVQINKKTKKVQQVNETFPDSKIHLCGPFLKFEMCIKRILQLVYTKISLSTIFIKNDGYCAFRVPASTG